MRRAKKGRFAEFNKESEKDMRKEWISAVVGIGLVFVAAIAFMCFCRYTDGRERADKNTGKVVYSIAGQVEETFVDGKNESADKRGFGVYKQLPEPLTKLVNTGIFAPTEEKVTKYREVYGDDFGDDEVGGDFQTTSVLEEDDYESLLEEIGKIGTEAYLKEISDIGPGCGDTLDCFLTWDESAGKFADTDKVAEIENCGFFGFSDLMARAEKMIKKRRAAEANSYGRSWDEKQCKIYCQGVEFDLSWCYIEKYYKLSCPINTAVYYNPEKYRNVIDGVTALGGYIPHYYSIGGKKEVLIFNRDNSVEYCSDCPIEDEEAGSHDNKRIAFIFEDGKLVDYYVTTDKNELMLDDVDKKILDQYVSGLGKTLSEHGEQMRVNDHEVRLYRAM